MSISDILYPTKNHYNINDNSTTIELNTVNPTAQNNTLWSNSAFSPPHIFYGAVDLENPSPGPSPSAMFEVYVNKAGNDVTGNGSILNPFLTITHAMSQVTFAGFGFPVGIFVGPGVYVENNLPIKGNVFIIGSGKDVTIVSITGTSVLSTGWSLNNEDESGWQNISIEGTGSMDYDFSAVNSNAGRISLISTNINISGTITITGNTASILNYLITNNLNMGSTLLVISLNNCNLQCNQSVLGALTMASTIALISASLSNSNIAGNLIITAGGGDTFAIQCENCNCGGTLNANGPITITSSVEFLPVHANVTLAGGATLAYLNDAYGEGYTPATPGNWPSVPATVQAALDDLAAGSPAGVLTTKGDLLGFSTVPIRVPAGSKGALLRYNSTNANDIDSIGDIDPTTHNTILGQAAGAPTGDFNTAFGNASLASETTGANNTAVGYQSLNSLVSVNDCVAIGYQTLKVNTAAQNTAVGSGALVANTSGTTNTAVGYLALNGNISGNQNTAVGSSCLPVSTGSQNTGIGVNCLFANTAGTGNTGVGVSVMGSLTTTANNTAIGFQSLAGIVTGATNIAVGYQAGLSLTTNDSNNICIGNLGTAGNNGVIKIGTGGTHTTCTISGISGVTSAGAVAVVINGAGLLGTVVSSRRYKKNIIEMEISNKLYDLHPVEFDYIQNNEHSYGLIAEDVLEVMPEIVVNDKNGLPETVQYHLLVPMLLNELIKLREQVQRLENSL